MPDLTPVTFYEKYLKPQTDVSNMVSLVHDPRHEYYKILKVNYLNNVKEGRAVTYVNVPIDVMISVASTVITKDTPVWFGCDVGKFFNRVNGLLDLDLFDYENAFGVKVHSINKADRLRYGESMMTHAMVFTGVNIENDKPGMSSFFSSLD